ncbi:hypothetical protein [Streptomyces adelaidensis]|uniref:hypothetical protein n=1 Tax=Streptomyces adelaidensis TaxID=2796465 RepID=UPI0019037E2D|nr:hypothetical protein [Streptomyces adelaidensis]
MSGPTGFWLVRPLPLPVKPFPRETEDSYLWRLSQTNKIPLQRLTSPSHWLLSQRDYVSRLSIVSGQPRASLLKAIPHLGKNKGDPGRPRQRGGYACRHCVARRTGSTHHSVWTWTSCHDQVCIPHRLWIGRAVDDPARQLDLTEFPEIVEAQRRHYRLLRRQGHLVMDSCYQYGSDFWHSLFQRGYRLSDRAERLRQLSPVTREVRPFDPRRYVAVYPEIVEAISLFASPYWRSLALTDNETKFKEFRAEFNRRLPQERALRTTARAWFLTELKRTAMRIEAAVQHDRPEPDLGFVVRSESR